ncbi:hypothetical protein ACSMXN_18905 [Jatrophihabitans sp. DSM 45814]
MTENPGSTGGSFDPNVPQAPAQYPPPAPPAPPQAPAPAPGVGQPGVGQQGVPPAPAYPPAHAYEPPPAYQAPPPGAPAGGYPPVDPNAQQWSGAPAPAGQSSFGGFDSKNLKSFDPKTVSPLDWGIIGAGVLTLLFSFFGYYKYSVKISILGSSQSNSDTFSAWHGFFGWFAALVAFAAAVLLAAELIAKMTLPFPVRLVVLGGFGLALLCTILALFVVPGPSGFSGAGVSFDKGHGFSYWLSLIILIAGTVLSYLRFQQTGGKLPNRAS